MKVLFVDGWYGPEPGDWQELWSKRLPDSARLEQSNWEQPERHAWVARLDAAIAACPEPPVLIAHSLGCLTVAHWLAGGVRRPVRAAMLVTPPDVERNHESAIQGFDPIPRTALPIPTSVIASGNDRWMTPERARYFADRWEAQFINAGDVGHLTVDDGHGPWPLGEKLLNELLLTAHGGGVLGDVRGAHVRRDR